MGTVIPFPRHSSFDRFSACDSRARRVIVTELLRAYDAGGNEAAIDMMHCLVWQAAEWSAKIVGAAQTERNFRNAGKYGYDHRQVQP